MFQTTNQNMWSWKTHHGYVFDRSAVTRHVFAGKFEKQQYTEEVQKGEKMVKRCNRLAMTAFCLSHSHVPLNLPSQTASGTRFVVILRLHHIFALGNLVKPSLRLESQTIKRHQE